MALPFNPPAEYHYAATVWYNIEAEDAEVYEVITNELLIAAFKKDPNIVRVFYQQEESERSLHWQLHFVLCQELLSDKQHKLKDWLWNLLDIHPKADRSCIFIRKARYPAASISYCQKERSRMEGPYIYDKFPAKRYIPPKTTILSFMNAPKISKII